MSKKLPIEEVRITAAMARIALSEEEVERMATELAAILDYAEKLAEVDVSGVEPMTHALPLPCPLREDAIGEHLGPEAALANAPRQKDGHFAVPAILAPGHQPGSEEG